MPLVYVLDVPEFKSLVDAARSNPAVQVRDSGKGYFVIEGDREIVFDRRAAGLKPAIWYGAFTGGLDGEIVEFGRDTARVTARDAAT